MTNIINWDKFCETLESITKKFRIENECKQKIKKGKVCQSKLIFENIIFPMLTINNDLVNDAKKYYVRRQKENIKINKVQNFLFNKFNKEFKGIAKIYRTSSLFSNINIIGESDIDFTIALLKYNSINVNKAKGKLEEFGFKFIEIRNKEKSLKHQHIVYHKFIERSNNMQIEIEAKIRPNKFMKPISALHQSVRKLPKKQLEIITYVKSKIKKISANAYRIWKFLVYEMVQCGTKEEEYTFL